MGAHDIEHAVKSLLTVNMGLQGGEKLLILGDSEGDSGAIVEEIAPLAEKFSPLCETLIFKPQGGHGKEPPEVVWRAVFPDLAIAALESEGLLGKLTGKLASEEELTRAEGIVGAYERSLDVIVGITHYSTSHTSFRRLLTAGLGVRYASMPLFEREMFFGPMDIDVRMLSDSTNNLARSLAGADRCEISAANGTELDLGITGRPVIADDGNLTAEGAFGNLPAGEVFLAPVEGTAEGVLVIDWGPLCQLEKPLTVRIERGRAVEVTGEILADVRWLDSQLAAHPENTNIAELGIGTNPGAKRPDNVLESEKILGTIHIAFGDNHTFGGKVTAPYHQDFVVFDASLTGVWECGGGRRVLLDAGEPGW